MIKVDFKKYAELIVRTGANVRPGQRVRLWADVDQSELAQAVTEECYKAGAAYVEMFWNCGGMTRLHYSYADTEVLGEVRPWEELRAKQMVDDLPVRIFIESADPDELAGIDPGKLSAAMQMRTKVLKKYRDAIDGKHQWVIAAAASAAWAKKVFPDLDGQSAVEKLWDAILSCVGFGTDKDPVEVWSEHIKELEERAEWLNAQKFTRLEYKSSNGTDFSVGLIPGVRWASAGDVNHENGAYYVPNMPTEEIFTSPMRGKCEGRLVATKPLSWSGQLIEDFSVEYRDGKFFSCSAKRGEESLRRMFEMDDGAAMLGEVALVPKESPVNRSGILFYNTLFDENACCHVAAGKGFTELVDGFLDMSDEQLKEKGLNDSIIHVDFMIGADDLEIKGYRADGSSELIFENGTWAKSAG